MIRILRLPGKLLLFVVIALCIAIEIVPPFLDRVYYRGPVSDHFDGQRFFNPEGEFHHPEPQTHMTPYNFTRFLVRDNRPLWPDIIPVHPIVPPRRVEGNAMRVTWIGHASVLVQTQGLNILTDPIWSDYASPFPPLGPRRRRAPGVRFEDLPPIDLVLISHNHYDHLDLPTLRRLWARDRPLIVTPLGNDAIIAAAGAQAMTRDWGGRVPVRPGIDVIVERVHHWDSRWGRDRNRALWSGFTVTLPGGNLFFAGDTGPGDMRWADLAATRGPIRMALIPIGAFKPKDFMSGNHIGPVEAVEAFEKLHARYALAVHWGTFQLAYEKINEPAELLATTLGNRHIASDRFQAREVGQMWNVPAN